ncbi:cysteine synthase-like [Anticarsia gemmatalis]|uniref:cysteine synthase-like n=1 Tax=Anticarsia gemmatalis TaxID=129554 RepID=UPI003F771212
MYNLVNVRMSLLEESQCQPENGEKLSNNNKVYNSILELVGNTPLVRLNRVPKDHGLSCDIYAKCEFLNPAGSIKDRVALAMIQDAKQAGLVNENTEFIEPTSGNTGIGIAFNAALMDNKCTIVMDVKNSAEKVDTMRLLGADVVQVKGKDRMIARQLKYENPDTAVILNQFENEINPKTHYETTGVEILSALDKVDMVVMGAGTGGTMTGVGRRIKEKHPDCVLVAAEPDGSIMINKEGKNHPFLVEGVGGAWVPLVLDKTLVDHVEEVSDQDAFLTARELARKEGLLCGGSSGAAMMAAIKAAKALNMGAGKRVVVILPDGIRNYMSKFVNDQWMEAHLFMDPPEHNMKWWNTPISELTLSHKYPMLKRTATCEQALYAMREGNVAVITNDRGHFMGAVSKDGLRNYATNPIKFPKKSSSEFDFNDLASEYFVKKCYTLAENGKKGMPTIGLLSRMLDITPFVIIGREGHDAETDTDYFEPRGVVTGDDILDYIHGNKYTKQPRRASRTWA